MEKLNKPTSNFLRQFDYETVPLEGHEFGEANLRRLLKLMHDSDPSNRDWATFFVSGSDVASDAVITALLKNSIDPHVDTKDEAILGLAKRGHPSAFSLVENRLADEWIGDLVIEAAGFVANRGLLPVLEEIQKTWDDHDDEDENLKRAIQACKNETRGDWFDWPTG